MEALWIAVLVLVGIVLVVVAVAVGAYALVVAFATAPLIIGIPLGIWVNQYSTGLGVAIILISVVIEVVWAIYLNER